MAKDLKEVIKEKQKQSGEGVAQYTSKKTSCVTEIYKK
jgi:hypothetical protein